MLRKSEIERMKDRIGDVIDDNIWIRMLLKVCRIVSEITCKLASSWARGLEEISLENSCLTFAAWLTSCRIVLRSSKPLACDGNRSENLW